MTQSISESIIDLFPHLLPQDYNLNTYAGFINIQGEEFQLKIQVPIDNANDPKSPRHHHAIISCCPTLHSLLAGSKQVIYKRLLQSTSLYDFLVEFKNTVSQILSQPYPPHPVSTNDHTSFPPHAIPYSDSTFGLRSLFRLPSVYYYSRLIQELGSPGIQWKNVTYINDDFSIIQIRLYDTKGREHLMDLTMSRDFPLAPPSISIALPYGIEPRWIANQSTLSDLVDQFRRHLALFQALWDEMDEMDANACVIEPENPTRADTYRRIIIAKYVCLRIEINVNHCRGIPICTFMGADTLIQPLREKLDRRIQLWNYQRSVLSNLEHLFEIKFPSGITSEKEDLQAACTICYGYRLNDQIPDRICDNPTCARPFHSSCLFNWLSTVQTHLTLNNLIWGKCPYCDMKISVQMPQSTVSGQ